MATTSKQIFDYLPGIWRLSRHTLTPLKQWQNTGAECIKADGFAAIIPSTLDSSLLIYSEKVTIANPNDSTCPMNGMVAKQKYKYRYDTIASTITKYFYDDRLFYTLKISDDVDSDMTQIGKATAGTSVITGCGEHLCIQDNYVASYIFQDQQNFVLKYSVNGPKKYYEIITEYEKCEAEIEPEQLSIQLGIRIENGEIV